MSWIPQKLYANLALIDRSPLLSSRPTALQLVFYDSPNRSGQDVISMSTNFNISSLKPLLRSAIYYAKHKRVLPTIKLAHLALHAMPRLTRVTKLSFTSTKVLGEPSIDATDDASLIIPEVIRTIGNHLQSLHIQSLFAIYLPPPPSLQLASLETFSIDACAPYHTREIHTIMLEKIPAFLLAHKSTIRNVSVAIDRCELDISPIFQCLQVMPYLYGIDLSLPYGYTRPFRSELDLVVAHQQHLGSLSLNFTPNTRNGSAILDFFPADCREATFPNVRTLTIPISLILFNRAPVTSMIIRQFSSSLVSLTLNDAFLPSSNSRGALPTFCQIMSSFPCLRDLSLSIYGFHMGDFSLFGRALPHLRSLFVNYYAVVTYPVSVFCKWDHWKHKC